ncbi:MAG: YicC family protein [Paludibacter sp.]|jgi:uncharacterized protein (TIGR00255 family)|nr:YicC family protein [Paludibacter sp.]
MLQSMTGYGKAVGNYANKKIAVEIKSLNSKQFDLLAKVACQYREKEIDIRNEVAQRLERGKIELSLTVEYTAKGGNVALFNTNLVQQYYWQMAEIAKNLNIEPPANLFQLLAIPEALKADSSDVADDEWVVVRQTVVDACNQLKNFRKQEGAALTNVFNTKIENIRSFVVQIEKYEKERIEKIRSRIGENMLSISETISYDKNRFEQELIYYIEKLDVSEEKVRLRNHLDYFLETMREHSCGKKLGFIAQEIGREVNTLGSKSNHSEMQKLVVLMKDELEQIKEQVLNVL